MSLLQRLRTKLRPGQVQVPSQQLAASGGSGSAPSVGVMSESNGSAVSAAGAAAASSGGWGTPPGSPSALAVSRLSLDDFDLLAVIGKGSFGKVLQVRKKDSGKIYALKALSKRVLVERNQVEHTKTERRVMQALKHPFVVKLYGAFQTNQKLYMLTEYVNGGELFFHLKREKIFSEDRVRFYAAEIVLAIEHVHKHGIVYRDLKPENILLASSGHVVITDFGLSKEMEDADDTTHTFCGTPEYLAPEILQGGGHGRAVDWWSLGTLVYEMLTGLPPFYNQNVKIMYDRILHAQLTFPPHMSHEARSLLLGLLERDPYLRLGGGVSDGEEIKSHPFFSAIDWGALERLEVVPPWKPRVESKADTRNIDPTFTREPVADSVSDSSVRSMAAEPAFDNFTFTAASLPATPSPTS